MMFRKKTPPVVAEDPQFNAAKKLFQAQWGNTLVTNSLLKFISVCLCLISMGLLYVTYRAYSSMANLKPLVIRIDEIGRAEAVTYQSLEYRPKEAEVKYFLSLFSRLYFSRNHNTLRDDFLRWPFFLEGKLANSLVDQIHKTRVLEKFLQDPNLPEMDIEVKNVLLEPMDSPPYKAQADLAKTMISRYDRTPLKRQISTVSFNYVFKTKVESSMIPINPLGLVITYFREDEQFNEPVEPKPEAKIR
jgi:type IV secretory pathway TrbF-like protein